MDGKNYSQINTSISVKENSFLTRETFNQLLQAQSRDVIANTLNNTDYAMTPEELNETRLIEKRLMRVLRDQYDFAYREAPDPRIVDIFNLVYVYHNLKVLMKMRATGKDLEDLLIDIGRYSINDLRYAVTTLESTVLPDYIVEELRQTWRSFEDYQSTEAIDVGIDLAYFHHLSEYRKEIDNETVRHIIQMMIDFFNITTAKRGLEQDRPNAFIYELMSTKGSQSMEEMLELVRNNEIGAWFDRVNLFPFGKQYDRYVTKMHNGTITAGELEYLRDAYIATVLDETRLEPFSPTPVLRYLFGKEMEVKNLRLVLLGYLMELDTKRVEERMRPVYGETI